MNRCFTKYILAACLILGSPATSLSSQDKTQMSPLNHLSFEGEMPNFISVTKGEIHLSPKHRVKGETGLKWDFVPGDALTIKGNIGYQPQNVEKVTDILGDPYPELNEPTLFRLPFYSEQKQDATLRVQFGTNDSVNCFIDIRLAFTGWRKFTIPYDRGHLRGTPEIGMNFMRIEILGDHRGTLFFDDPLFAYRDNPRSIKSTPLVPALTNHPQRLGSGANVVERRYLNRPWFPLQDEISQSQIQSFQTIEDRFYELEWGGRKKVAKFNAETMNALRNAYSYFKITRYKGSINGLHLDNGKDRTKFNKLVKSVGTHYQHAESPTQKKELAQMGLDLIEHGIDVDNKTTWYDGRGFAEGCYLLKEPLRSAGLLEKSITFLRRKFEFGMFYDEDLVRGRHGSVSFSSDAIYNDSFGFIICVLLMDNSPEKVRDMQHLTSFYSHVAFNYANGLCDTFKPDGSHYHHANAATTRYSAYTMPMVSEVIRILSKTDFRISEEAHERMKQNVLIRRFYRTKNYFPYVYSNNRIRPLTFQNFDDSRHLALAGTPDGLQAIDQEMAAVYLRMMDGDTLPKDAMVFQQLGIRAEPTPHGHHTMSYSGHAIHRVNDWMAVVGGHSRYIYQKENWSWHPTRGNVKYGMFENWGSLELIYPDKAGLEQVDNGRTLDGWDWTKIPGVTSIEAPLKRIQIQTTKRGDDTAEEHLRSDQAFVGGLDFSDGDGIFTMKVHGHDKYHLESFYATKSWFFFNNLIVCLGSDIRNDLPQYPTHTCLFQNSFDVTDFSMHINTIAPLKDQAFEFTSEGKEDSWLVDSRKVGYYVPKGQAYTVSYGMQHSRDFQDRKNTEAKIEKAWLSHGHAPDGEKYEYAVKMEVDAKTMRNFATKQANEGEYKVWQANEKAHIVECPKSHTMAYIAYEKNYELNMGLIQGISHSGICMLKEEDGKIKLAVSDPDLRLYEGFNSDIVDLQMHRKEEPSYSNYWHGHASIPSKIKVFVKGEWNLGEVLKGNGKVLYRNKGITAVEFECKDGLSNEVELVK